MHQEALWGDPVWNAQEGVVGAHDSQADEGGQVAQPVGKCAGRAALLPQGQVGLLQLGWGIPQQVVPQAGAGLQSLQPSEVCQSLAESTPFGTVPAAGGMGGHLLQPGAPCGEVTG